MQQILITVSSYNIQMSTKDIILKLAERYLRSFPTPEDISLTDGMLKMVYSYSNPFINAKTQREVFRPIKHIEAGTVVDPRVSSCNYSLQFDEKSNILKQANSFDGILTEEVHEKVIQDDVFGKARLNKDRTRWVYVAKKKAKKPKSYFLGGTGKAQFVQDFGETYEGVN